ncbi:MAG TPA: YHS domain-containing protein [Candidatus Limnocylindria bacterium]|nr:YHS domain-containing protein [Candidatus Limnocylindria bacterium]
MSTHDILDPICDMVVDVPAARAKGLTVTHDGAEYGFCGPGCMKRFQAEPAKYTTKVQDWLKRQGR